MIEPAGARFAEIGRAVGTYAIERLCITIRTGYRRQASTPRPAAPSVR